MKALPLALLLAGCATIAPGTRTDLYAGCDGATHAVEVETRVGLPWLDCTAIAARTGQLGVAALAFVGGAMGCATVWQPYPNEPRFHKAIVILPPVTLEAIAEHEYAHTRGMRHLSADLC